MGRGLPRRKRTRASHLDYDAAGAYFVTICTAGRACILGEVTTRGEVRLSAIGEAVERTLTGIPTRWPTVFVDAYVVMPNHVHAILWLQRSDEESSAPKPGAPLVPTRRSDRVHREDSRGRASPSPTAGARAASNEPVGAGLVPARMSEPVGAGLVPARMSEPVHREDSRGRASPSPTAGARAASSEPAVVATPSLVATAACVPAPRVPPTLSAVVGAFKSLAAHAVGHPLWQRSFHDHVIRDEDDLAHVRRYIGENPLRWSLDELHPDATTPP